MLISVKKKMLIFCKIMAANAISTWLEIPKKAHAVVNRKFPSIITIRNSRLYNLLKL